jgi:hypothetical protein
MALRRPAAEQSAERWTAFEGAPRHKIVIDEDSSFLCSDSSRRYLPGKQTTATRML